MASILGVKVDNITRQQAIERVGQLLRSSGQYLITTPNPEFIVAAQKNEEFRAILNQTALALPDGVGLLFAGRFLGVPLKERIAGSDFVWDIAQHAARGGYSIYLLGAGEGVAHAAAEKLKIKNEKLKIVGAESGISITPSPLMGEGRGEGVIARIRDTAPDIILVALGHGKQEKWIAAHLSEMPSVKIAMGVGGALDFIAGRVRRAPHIFRVLGLEWLWRLLLEPRRLPRIFSATIVFPLLVLRAKMRYDGVKEDIKHGNAL